MKKFTKEQLIEWAQDSISGIEEALNLSMNSEMRERYSKSVVLIEIALTSLNAMPDEICGKKKYWYLVCWDSSHGKHGTTEIWLGSVWI